MNIKENNEYCDVEIDVFKRVFDKKINFKVDKSFIKAIEPYKWYLTKDGYLYSSINGKKVSLHQLVIGKKEGYIIDHINHDRLDNRTCNLRHITKSFNSFNRKGVNGICKSNGKWHAQICKDYKHMSLGRFDNKEDAVKARKEAEIKYFGENNTIL